MEDDEPLKGFRRRWQKRRRLDEDLEGEIDNDSFPEMSLGSDADIQSFLAF